MAKKKKKKGFLGFDLVDAEPSSDYVKETGALVGSGLALGAGSAIAGGIGGPGADKVAGAFGTAAGFLPAVAGLSAAKFAVRTLSPKKKKKRKKR